MKSEKKGLTSKTRCVVLLPKIGHNDLVSCVCREAGGDLEWYGASLMKFQRFVTYEKRKRLSSKTKYVAFFHVRWSQCPNFVCGCGWKGW